MIYGRKIKRPTKQDLADAVADLLNLDSPNVSNGSSVDSTFLDEVHTRITGGPSGGSDTYRKTERLLLRLGRTYDPYWDTSESRGRTGGGTVTVRAYSQLLAALSGVDRCFLLPALAGSLDNGLFHLRPGQFALPGQKSLIEAGPGSRVLLYGTDTDGRRAILASAVVNYIYSGWDGPWNVSLAQMQPLSPAVPLSQLAVDGWGGIAEVVEIAPQVVEDVLRSADSADIDVPMPTIPSLSPSFEHEAGDDSNAEDPAGGVVAKRILSDFPVDQATPDLQVPDTLPPGALSATAAVEPSYRESDEGVVVTGSHDVLPRSRNRQRDKLAEERAITLAVNALEGAGWTLYADRQRDGVGYDLEFRQGGRTLHVEVKGIQGSRLAFNVTPKEFWRAQSDDLWVVVAVTRVLSPVDYEVHLVTRDRVVASRRVVTGYRVSVSSD